jgi:hypothetical protein
VPPSRGAAPARGAGAVVSRLDIVISDNISVRCDCKVKGKNPWIHLLHEFSEPFLKRGKKFVNIVSRVECEECGASWTWGQP